MTKDEIFAMIAAERRSTADLLETFTDEQWGTQSLCGLWTVREVAAHLTAPWEVGTLGFVPAILVSAGNFDKANDRVTKQLAKKPVKETIASLRKNTKNRFTPPGFGPEAPLTDIVVHTQDMCRPLGIDREVAPDRTRVILDLLTKKRANRFRGGHSLNGLRFVADDQDWSWGEGAEVRGPSVPLALFMHGRLDGAKDLTGDGLEEFRTRLAG